MITFEKVCKSYPNSPEILQNINLEISGKDEKFPVGPIIDPNPGPTLEIEVAAPDIEVMKSRPDNESSAEIIKKITRYI